MACFSDDYGMFLGWFWHVSWMLLFFFLMIMACFLDEHVFSSDEFWYVFQMIMACFSDVVPMRLEP